MKVTVSDHSSKLKETLWKTGRKNYGGVHDTKASMMYNRFLKQYNERLSGGPIPIPEIRI